MKLEENAKLTKLMIGHEDHGIFGFNLNFEFDGCHQGTGYYCLYNKHFPDTPDSTGKLIRGLLKVFDVDDISKIEGKYCRIKKYKTEHNSPIEEVGNIMANKWLLVRTLEMKDNNEK